MEKHPDDLLTGDSDPFKGDPNFMASLARGLEVIQAFTPAAPAALNFADQPKDRHSARGGTPLPVYAEQTGLCLRRRW